MGRCTSLAFKLPGPRWRVSGDGRRWPLVAFQRVYCNHIDLFVDSLKDVNSNKAAAWQCVASSSAFLRRNCNLSIPHASGPTPCQASPAVFKQRRKYLLTNALRLEWPVFARKSKCASDLERSLNMLRLLRRMSQIFNLLFRHTRYRGRCWAAIPIVSSSSTVRPCSPWGGRWIGHWRTTWSTVCSSAPNSQAAEEVLSNMCKQERKRPAPVRRRLSRTQAVLGKVIPGGWVPVAGMKVRSLLRLSNHPAFHWWSAHCAAHMLLLSDENASKINIKKSLWSTTMRYAHCQSATATRKGCAFERPAPIGRWLPSVAP